MKAGDFQIDHRIRRHSGRFQQQFVKNSEFSNELFTASENYLRFPMQVPYSKVLEHLAENPVVPFVELRLRHSAVAELFQGNVNVRESEIMHEK